MSLVDQEYRVVFGYPFLKIPSEIYRRVEGVVVIADYEVAVFREIERQLVWADAVLLRRLCDHLLRVARAGRNKFGNGVGQPFVIALRVRTFVGVAEG